MRINWIMAGANMAGGTKSNRLIAEAMVRRGHDVTIAYPDVARPWPSPLRAKRCLRRLQAELLTRRKQPHQLERSIAHLLPVRHCPIRPSDVPDADVTIATWWETMEWINEWPASKGMKAYFIRHYEVHGGDPRRVTATYRMAAQKLVIARWLQRLMLQEFDDANAVLVPNGVDWTQFHSEPRRRASVPTIGIMYGRQAWKGSDTAFSALRLSQQRLPSMQVVCFGSSPLPQDVLKPGNFSYFLRPAQEEIPRLYRLCDAWIVSSTLEGFGMPGLEAAACRCPIVATRCGGPEDYVEDGVNGYLVPVGDAKAMADAILRILRLDKPAWQRMSEASYQIARRFDWDRSAELLEEALLSAVERERSFPRQVPIA